MKSDTSADVWPELNYADWKETCATLHMWTQIVGKIRLTLTPWTNHSWHVTLYVTSRGLTTSPIPHGTDTFEIRFDFIDHQLRILKSDGGQRSVELKPRSVADFYKAVMSALNALDLAVKIDILPNEIPNPIPFDRDEQHRSYDPKYANRFWRVLVQTDRVFKEFRSRFCGKCSPVHFFWGAPDLAVEVSSLGFWPGADAMPMAIFYSYAYPEPAGFSEAKVKPDAASYNAQFREFVLPYDAVRTAKSPDDAILDFAQSTYDAASQLGNWDRATLEEKKPSLHSARQHS